MTTKKKIRCERHYITKRGFEHYIFSYSWNNVDYYQCLICKEIRDKQIERYEAHEKRQQEEYRQKWIRDDIKYENRLKQRKINMETQLWDCFVIKEITKGMGLKGNAKYKFQDSLPIEFIRLVRATIKLKRTIKSHIEKKHELFRLEQERLRIANAPIIKCATHGNCYERNVIKAGTSRWTGKQLYKCKRCMKELHHNHYQENKEKIRLQQAEYRKNRVKECQK